MGAHARAEAERGWAARNAVRIVEIGCDATTTDFIVEWFVCDRLFTGDAR